MANKRITIDLIVNNLMSGELDKAKRQLIQYQSSLSTSLNNSLINSSIKFENALKSYNNSMYKFNRVVGNIARVAGDSIYNFTKDAINNFSELERQHAKTMGAMATDYAKTAEAQAKFLSDSEKLKQQAIRIGTVGVNGQGSLNTIQDISYAQTALVKSGMSANNILNSDVVESILKFAGGNDLDVDTATTFAVNLGTVFNKPVEEWGKMLDMVTKAADISVIDVEDIMDSLTYTGGIASGLGRDLEEVLGVISVMGQAGLRGRVAGTGLQAFFTRILSSGELSDTQIGNAPTEYVGQIYNAFTAEAVNADGSFRDMDEVASLLNTAMSSLNDQEQAWFAKKLFGLYQMKAAYAITGAVDGDANMITDFINQIANESSGANTIKYELMQASQYGKITSLQNAWAGTKTDFGDRLSPVVSVVADELLAFLSNNGNYEINWDKLRDAISESGDLIGEKYGNELGRAIENFGNLGINAGIIADAMLPYAGGVVNGFSLLLQGDLSGALDEFSRGIEDTNKNIDGLPEELQGSAEAARNVIVAFTNLATLNLGTQILQIITTAFNTFIGKPLKWLNGKINSTSTSVTSTTTTINSATVNIGNVPLMNVTATVVNVYGGSGSNPTNPTNPTTPTLPSSPTVPMLPSGSGGGGSLVPWVIGGGGAGLAGAKMLTDGMGTGRIITMYKVGNSYYTASQIAASAGKMLGVAGIIAGTAITQTGSTPQEDIIYKNTLSKGIEEGYDNNELRQYLYDNFYDDNRSKDWAVQQYDAQTEMYSKWLSMSDEVATQMVTSMKNELNKNGSLSEAFLSSLVTNTGSTGGIYRGGQADLEFLLNTLFGTEYKTPWMYSGSFADNYTSKYIQDALENGALNFAPVSSVAIANQDIVNKFNNMADRMQSPTINVNVTTNVDKSGNATTNVDINKISTGIARRASQYGQTHMVN